MIFLHLLTHDEIFLVMFWVSLHLSKSGWETDLWQPRRSSVLFLQQWFPLSSSQTIFVESFPGNNSLEIHLLHLATAPLAPHSPICSHQRGSHCSKLGDKALGGEANGLPLSQGSRVLWMWKCHAVKQMDPGSNSPRVQPLSKIVLDFGIEAVCWSWVFPAFSQSSRQLSASLQPHSEVVLLGYLFSSPGVSWTDCRTTGKESSIF